MNSAPSIVVGVDGSAAGQQALQWALREGDLRHSTVRAVHSWTVGQVADFTWRTPRQLRADSRSLLRHALEHARQMTNVRAPVESISVQGPAASTLTETARGAALLVLGAYRVGPGGQGRLGSVATRCAALTSTPIVVVPQSGPVETLETLPPQGLAHSR
ncbi:universal stress protein [Amycolatopsis anabasis]|uniref:universal stress protein n=1 Tax=Amycolatopsis anabasis TaxID=1840409 RepID=UPI00131CEA84|nr:universal stress protein [Amycolatopsis anabasis]